MKFMNVYIYNYCRTSRVLDVDELVSARTCLQKKGVDNCSQKNEGVDGTTEIRGQPCHVVTNSVGDHDTDVRTPSQLAM